MKIHKIIDPENTENNDIMEIGFSIIFEWYKFRSGLDFSVNFDENTIIRIEYMDVKVIEKIIKNDVRLVNL